MSDERRCVDCDAGFVKPPGSKNRRCQPCMRAYVLRDPEPDYEAMAERATRGPVGAVGMGAVSRDLVCDFCAAPDPRWSCPAADFDTGLVDPDIGLPASSSGAWSACDTCAAFVRNGRRLKLEGHCLTAMIKRLRRQKVAIGVSEIPTLKAALRDLHDTFWAHRQGPPRRTTDEEIERLKTGAVATVEPRGDLPRRREPRWVSDLQGRT